MKGWNLERNRGATNRHTLARSSRERPVRQRKSALANGPAGPIRQATRSWAALPSCVRAKRFDLNSRVRWPTKSRRHMTSPTAVAVGVVRVFFFSTDLTRRWFTDQATPVPFLSLPPLADQSGRNVECKACAAKSRHSANFPGIDLQSLGKQDV